MLKRIDHVGVIVQDLEGMSRLLSEVLGMELTRTLDVPERRLRARFFRCGDVDVELVELGDPEERARRLGDGPTRIEHIAIEVDDVAGTQSEMAEHGIRMTTPEPQRLGPTASIFSQPDTSGGVMLQFLQRVG
ncbi:MAG TPA: VOC family protein [Candidatus Eisenbacteria bacterium]|nr:VOC family protein [Candidatus Eisenbacteria bacterium]